MASRRIRGPLRVEPLWRRVERNRVRVALFVASIVVIGGLITGVVSLAVGGALLVGASILAMETGSAEAAELIGGLLSRPGAALAIAAIVGFVLSAAYAVRVMTQPLRRQLRSVGASPVPRGELLGVKHALKDMSIAAGVDPAPELFVFESPAVNALLVARGDERPVCAVTRGLVDRFDPEEQRAVFANLMARHRAGDVQWATVVSAFMAPLWRWREWDSSADARGDGESERLLSFVAGDGAANGYASRRVRAAGRGGGRATLPVWAWLAYVAAIVVSELVALHHRHSQLVAAEAADAEGMLLLKDPRTMLRTLDRAVRADNRVRLALPLYSQAFYIWAGDDLVDDADPEWERLARLREVLGVEGLADSDREATELVESSVGSGWGVPVAPRLEGVAAMTAPRVGVRTRRDPQVSPAWVAFAAFFAIGAGWTCLIMVAVGADPRLVWLAAASPVAAGLVAWAVRKALGGKP